MSLVDAFKPEDRFNITYSELYTLTKEAAKAELILNAINCNVPHEFIREMATGKKEETIMKSDLLNIDHERLSEMMKETREKQIIKSRDYTIGKADENGKITEINGVTVNEEADPESEEVEEEQNQEGEKGE